jgi:hypothetical protein
MLKFDHLTSAQDLERHATADKDRLLVQLLTTMTDRIVKLEEQLDHSIVKLEARLDRLSDLTVGDQLGSFDERVLEVLDVRSGSARAALQLEDTDVQRWMMSAIEENSAEAFGHIEAEIEEKLEGFIESHSFNEAVSDAVKTVSGLGSTIEEVLEDVLHDAILNALGDPEEIVRKGLRSIL